MTNGERVELALEMILMTLEKIEATMERIGIAIDDAVYVDTPQGTTSKAHIVHTAAKPKGEN